MEKDNKNENIDVKAVVHRLWKKKWFLLRAVVITFILACLYIVPQPRFYKCTVELAPELGKTPSSTGRLAGIASTMGLNLNSSALSDAISPELYPELMKSNNFIVKLINCHVTTKDGKVSTTYYDYLAHHQKGNPYMAPLAFIKNIFASKEGGGGQGKLNPFNLSKNEDDIFNAIRGKIKLNVDRKTDMVTISVDDQDPLVAATMADSAMAKLQDFIIDYRTNKAQHDANYYRNLTVKAKQEYERARQLYGSYSDANMDVMLESYRSKREDLENDMQLKFNAYSSRLQQQQTAEAKVLENTPAFTEVKSAAVPLKPAGPKRMIFVAGMTLLVFFISCIVSIKDLII